MRPAYTGYLLLFEGAEPTYAHIEEGEWLNDESLRHDPSAGRRRAGPRLFQCAAEHCKSISSNVRVDTHANNTTMRG